MALTKLDYDGLVLVSYIALRTDTKPSLIRFVSKSQAGKKVGVVQN
ncbi:hypothetical protein SAMN04488136_11635 [Vibrio xiamenensis]|uniref:Uncharacterized protein n=1 Tax=Vibrio xiamenensis TaxID=861298 RepID=A0A1G8CF67_9VIBR|nr:hypothetical protein SAMN04488136_11635 [Vibrio xiamenensis]